MISIIICSRKTDISKSQQINLSETIGSAFEIICIDNSENKYSIFQAYNLGASQAKFPFLCFIHDDIIFQTANWGINLIQHFEDSEFGLIGVVSSCGLTVGVPKISRLLACKNFGGLGRSLRISIILRLPIAVRSHVLSGISKLRPT